MALQTPPVARAQMLIRKPVHEVFRAFVDPAVTTRFWFTKGSGKLEPGKSVRWEWEMYGAAADVRVQTVEQDKRIAIEWGGGGRSSIVEWEFEPRKDETTVVRITNRGFAGNDDEQVAQALDSQGGFTNVLAGAKAYLEHGLELNLTADHHPR